MARTFFAMLFAATAVAVGAASAQELGDPARGLAYAEAICTECHAVAAGEPQSPLPEAPAFQAIAEEPSATELSLIVFLRTPHATMPNLIVDTADARDLIAYILSLRR